MIVAGFIISVIGVLQVGGVIHTTSTVVSSTGQISLTSVSYMAEDWDPRRIDLSHTEADGIPVVAGQSLKFFDLWVTSSSETGSSVYAEVFANGKTIGVTTEQVVASNQPLKLGDIQITNYEHAKVAGAWQVQPEWKEISVVLNQIIDGQPVKVNETKIKLNRDGKAWFLSPPNAALVFVAYKINDGSEVVMDLSSVMQNGIDTTAGDKLTLTHAWYKSNLSDNTRNIRLEAYLSAGNYDSASLVASPYIAIRDGVNSLSDLGNLTWTIPAEKVSLVMTLARNDRTVLDRYTIPLQSESASGLVPLTNAIQGHFSEFTYFDFEQKDDLMDWESTENTAIGIRSEYAFTGSHALAVGNKTSETQVFTIRRVPFRASYITGQVYWPKAENISVSWAQICLGGNVHCVSISQEAGQWNPFLVDLRQIKDDDGIPYSEKEIPDLFFQGAFNGVSQENQYLFYIDGIQIYPVKTP